MLEKPLNNSTVATNGVNFRMLNLACACYVYWSTPRFARCYPWHFTFTITMLERLRELII